MTLTEGFPDDLTERMRGDEIDIAFIGTSISDPEGVLVNLLLDEAMVVALPTGHALARQKTLTLKALAGETFILFGRPGGALTSQSHAVVAACQDAGFEPHLGPAVPHISSRLNLVAAGLGIAVVAASLRRMNIEGVVYRPLKSAGRLKVPLNLVTRRSDSSAAVQQFVKLAKRVAATFRG